MADEEEPRRVIEKPLEQEDPAFKLLRQTIGRSKALYEPKYYEPDRPDDSDSGIQALLRKPIDVLDGYTIALVSSTIYVQQTVRLDDQTTRQITYPQEPPPDSDDVVLHTRAFEHFHICLPDEQDSRHVAKIRKWCNDVKAKCEAALACGARIVVFGELSYPNSLHSRSTDVGADDPQPQLRQIAADLDSHLLRLAQEHEAIIIAGSYHHPHRYENLCHIYFPRRDRHVPHLKLTSARAVGEYIKVPQGTHYPIYKVGDLMFCVLICCDAFDLNIFFRQLCRNTNHPDVIPHIFFVPSYHVVEESGRHQMLAACQQLSLATGSVVMFINQSFDDDRNAVFVAGERARSEPHEGDFSTFRFDAAAVKESELRTYEVRQKLVEIFHRI